MTVTLSLVVIYLFFYFLRLGYWAKIFLKRQLEITGKETYEATLTFMNEQIEIKNLVTGSRSHLKYEYIRQFAETKNQCVFVTKTLMFTCFNKSNFENDHQRQEFLTFILGKCVNLKRKK